MDLDHNDLIPSADEHGHTNADRSRSLSRLPSTPSRTERLAYQQQSPHTPISLQENNNIARQFQVLSSHQKRLDDQARKIRALSESKQRTPDRTSTQQSPNLQENNVDNSLARWGVVNTRTPIPDLVTAGPIPQVISPFRTAANGVIDGSQHIVTHVDVTRWTKTTTSSAASRDLKNGSPASTPTQDRWKTLTGSFGGAQSSTSCQSSGPENTGSTRKRKLPWSESSHSPTRQREIYQSKSQRVPRELYRAPGHTLTRESSQNVDVSTPTSTNHQVSQLESSHISSDYTKAIEKLQRSLERNHVSERKNNQENKSRIVILHIPPKFNSIWKALELRSKLRRPFEQRYNHFLIAGDDDDIVDVHQRRRAIAELNNYVNHPPKSRLAAASASHLDDRTYPQVISRSASPRTESDVEDSNLEDVENMIDYEIYDPFEDDPDVAKAISDQLRYPPRQQVRFNRTAYVPTSNPNIKPLDETPKKPYLSREGRNLLQEIDTIDLLSDYEQNFVHMPFDRREQDLVWLMVRSIHSESKDIGHMDKPRFLAFAARRFQTSEASGAEMRDTIKFLACMISPYLENRTEDDITQFILDSVRDDQESSLALACVSNNVDRRLPWTRILLQRELGIDSADCKVLNKNRTLKFLQPHKHFEEGSSDVIDVAWCQDNDNFALACITHNDQYNRSGNLIIGSVDKDLVKPLPGHWTRREVTQNVLDPHLYSTVTRVEFSGDVVLSASYDHTIKIWDLQGNLVNGIPFRNKVLSLSCNPSLKQVFAAGIGDGTVSVLRTDGEFDLSNHQMRTQLDKNLEPTNVLWNSSGQLFVGYDAKGGGYQGDLKVFDTQACTEICSVRPAATRHFDICLDASERILISGVGIGLGKRQEGVNSHVRVFDWQGMRSRCVIEFDSPQRDLNKVTTSRCGRYITSSATDGTTVVFDIRSPEQILHILKHGDPKMPEVIDEEREIHDTGVNFASWYRDSDYLVTGSSDGVVKVWNPRNGDPFCYNLASLDGPIMSGSFSPDDSKLMIGLATGSATMLSHLGDGDSTTTAFEIDNTSMRTMAPISRRREARIAATELVVSGKVVLREAFDGRRHAFGA